MLLLNAALTVRAHEANSHAKKGWQDFTTAAIKALSSKRRGLVFLLWGKNAQAVEPLIAVGKHHILKSVHPSGLSAARVRLLLTIFMSSFSLNQCSHLIHLSTYISA